MALFDFKIFYLRFDLSVQGDGFSTTQRGSPVKDVARDFSNVSLRDPQYDLDGPPSYFPDTKPLSSTVRPDHSLEQQLHRNIGTSCCNGEK